MVFIFDIGNVLIDFDLPLLLKTMSNHAQMRLEDLVRTWTTQDTFNLETGKVDSKSHFEQYAHRIELDWSYDDWKKAWIDIYTVNQEGLKIFLSLKDKGFPVYMLSNLAEYNKESIQMKFKTFFTLSDGNFFSYELGLIKPDPEIYLRVCSQIGILPQQCVFIDDLAENIEGARNIGMQAIRFSRNRIDRVHSAIGRICGTAPQ